jgi:hypothetical protein
VNTPRYLIRGFNLMHEIGDKKRGGYETMAEDNNDTPVIVSL